MHTAERPRAVSIRNAGILGALSLAAFCYVTSETLPIGLLSPISASVGVSPASVGLLVTWYAITVVVVTIPLVYGTRNVPRRRLMILLLASLVVTSLAAAAAGSYGFLLATRLATALGQAVFWAVVSPTVAAMFDVRIRGRVMSIVFAGASLGPMLGVPFGTWIGQRYGWRAAFVALALLSLLAFVALVRLMPEVVVEETHAATGVHPDTRRYAVVVAANGLSVAGLFTAFTYTEVFLTEVVGFAAIMIGPLLFARGVAEVVGITAGGYASDHRQRATTIGSAVIQAGALLGMYVFTDSRLTTAVLLAVSGFAMGALSPAIQSRVMEVAPGNTELASAGNSVAFNVGISTGSLLGAAVLSGAGVRDTAGAGGVLMLAALAVMLAEPLIAAGGRGPRTGEPRSAAPAGSE